ncbi:TPA: transposase, partial [Staphylococcus aureus]|nr:transposase [Staphylococcus aureus]HDJ3578660.1 transposase [Staphylococcus aureus]
DETESTPIIPHQGYLKEKKRAHKQNQFHRDNWTYNELDDYYICPNQKRVVFSHYSQRKDRNGFIRNFKIYECEDCTGCPLREKCTKAKEGKNRRLNINPTWEYIKIKANEKIESKETASYYAQRKIDVETVFGNIKQNMKFKRFHVRGAEKIFKEMGLVFLAHNFRKLVTRVRKYEGKTIIQNQI